MDLSNLNDYFNDFSKVVNFGMARKLRLKQMQDAFFMCAMNKSGNFSVPGSGKTSSVLGVYRYFKSKDIIDKIVMIGPKNSFGSWIDEFKVCFENKEELNLFNIHDSQYKTLSQKKKSLLYDSGKSNLLLFNYESIGSFEKEISNLVRERTLLVFDEVHKVKRVQGEYATHALNISKNANYIVALTGTPIPNTYQDLYNFLHILFHNEYKEFFGFSLNTLKNPSDDEIDTINSKIQPFFCRTTKKELNVPEANKDLLFKIQSNDNEQMIFDILLKKYRKNKLTLLIRILQLESNPRLLLEKVDINEFSKVLDITDVIEDIDFVDYTSDIINLINEIEITSKKKKCIDIVEKLVNEGKKVIIWCIFKDSISSINNHLKNKGIKVKSIYGEVELNDRLKLISDFKNNEFDVLITNPHTLAESVSLHSVCHDAIYYEYSYNLVHMLQSKDRIHRLGLESKQYTQYYFLQVEYNSNNEKISLDNNIYERLVEKEQTMLDAIDNNRLEKIYSSDEDLEIIFRRF